MNRIKERRENAEVVRKFWKSDKHWNMQANHHYNDFISRANQYCQKSMYNCSKCINKSACDVSKRYPNY